MEAAGETLTYRDVTGFHRKLLPEKVKNNPDDNDAMGKRDESSYADLNMKPDGVKTVKVSFTGEGNHLLLQCDSAQLRNQGAERKVLSEDLGKQSEDARPTVSGGPSLEPLGKLSNADRDENEQRVDPSDKSDAARSESDELHYTDMYLNSKTESDDGASAVLSDYCGYETVENEPHYITTHEIQPTELDDDIDYDQGRGTCWDFEDNNLVFSFVDYASFESDETQEGTLVLEGMNQTKIQPRLGGAVSTEQEDSDLCDSEKSASSDESEDKHRFANVGEIHLSIKTSSRAMNEPVGIAHNAAHAYTKDFGDRSHCPLVSSGAIAEPFRDRSEYFIPAPGRQHLATNLRRKDINEYSSGASSSISELDDADKEVRNLTAKSFRSLACPYFDAINLSTSSESSMSEYGLNKWSSYMDWNYGNITHGEERRVIAHKTSSEAIQIKNTVGDKRYGVQATQNKMYALHKATLSRQSSSSEMKDTVQTTQRGVTLNVRCNVNEPEVTRRTKCSKKGAVFARSGCDMQYHHTDSTESTHKRAVFASSLLKNVISKKMQFEQERKLERGEVCETRPARSPRFQLKDHDGVKERSQERAFQRQSSESGSGFNSTDDQHSRCSSCESAEESGGNKVTEDFNKSMIESAKGLLSTTPNMNSSSEDKPEPVSEVQPLSVNDTKEGSETISMQSKLLFVPSCQLLSKKRFPKDLPMSVTGSVTGAPAASRQFGHNFSRGETEKGGKTPEIKICLRSVKENEGCTLNIANLLTPKISYNSVGTFRSPGDADAKCHILSSLDKMPSFTVRDIRDTKCKFHTPIYHVRDVRKLVKSSYQFVSLDKSDSKCTAAADKLEEKEPVIHAPLSPIVIKCQSVNTNVKPHTTEASPKQAGNGCHSAQSENSPMHCTTSRSPYVVSRPPEIQTNVEGKPIKQILEKFESKEPKQAALEKLKAAVKTMEQLYVFDRNEWKRKTHTPQTATDSHALPLITSEERGAERAEETIAGRIPQSKGARDVKSPCNTDVSETQSRESKTFSTRSSLHFGRKTCANLSSVTNPVPQSSMLQTSLAVENSNTPAAPLSVKIESQKNSQVEQRKIKINPAVTQASSDSENYLTIPGLGNASRVKLLNHESVSQEVNPDVQFKATEQKKSPVLIEYPAVPSVLHHSGVTTGFHAQQQVLCLSPSVPTASPTPSTGDPQTQRKMLLDPTTGHYYLVDTPIHPPTRRLFDPETGQYVDVPMPHSPAAHVTPVTPVSLSVSPLTLNPAAYAPTYMIYPGFVPSPTLPAQPVFPKQQYHSENTGGEVISKSPRPEITAPGSESAYYSATSEAPPGPQHQPGAPGHVTTRGGALSSDRKPVISITTQQGPRIIAPPSFDGTTMSFVVEHR